MHWTDVERDDDWPAPAEHRVQCGHQFAARAPRPSADELASFAGQLPGRSPAGAVSVQPRWKVGRARARCASAVLPIPGRPSITAICCRPDAVTTARAEISRSSARRPTNRSLAASSTAGGRSSASRSEAMRHYARRRQGGEARDSGREQHSAVLAQLFSIRPQIRPSRMAYATA